MRVAAGDVCESEHHLGGHGIALLVVEPSCRWDVPTLGPDRGSSVMNTTDIGQDFAPSDSDWRVIRCPRCRWPLVLHQPDTEVPDRLLATCGECKSWFLLATESAELIPLPDISDGGAHYRLA
jgi:hypothetical protein